MAKDKQKELAALRKEFQKKFTVLKREQDKVIKEFLAKVRAKRISDIKSSL